MFILLPRRARSRTRPRSRSRRARPRSRTRRAGTPRHFGGAFHYAKLSLDGAINSSKRFGFFIVTKCPFVSVTTFRKRCGTPWPILPRNTSLSTTALIFKWKLTFTHKNFFKIANLTFRIYARCLHIPYSYIIIFRYSNG